MGFLREWTREIRARISDLEGKSPLSIDRPISGSEAKSLALDGFPAVVPLWKSGMATIGLLASPELEPAEWRAIAIKEAAAATIASNAAVLLPCSLVFRVIANYPNDTARLAERWQELRARALALHETLGGKESTLEPIAETLADVAARERLKLRRDNARDFQQAVCDLLLQIDQSREFAEFASWLNSRIDGSVVTPAVPKFGPWARQAIRRAISTSPADDPGAGLQHDALRRIIEDEAGADGVKPGASWTAFASVTETQKGIVQTAWLLAEDDRNDEPTRMIAKAIADAPLAYSGLAHAEATALLDERNEPRRAWGTITSAAWWSARNAKNGTPKIIEAARYLAGRRRWDDISWVLREAAAEDAP